MDEVRIGFLRPPAGWASHAVRASLLLALLTALPFCGQSQAQPPQLPSEGQAPVHPVRLKPPDMDQMLANDESDPIVHEMRLRQLNAAQHKSMVADADKLLKLAAELNAEINSANPGSLTPDQIRKVAEIEKLAHNVKDKMRTSVRGAPAYVDATPPPPPPRR
jgi:hypothetical protein